METYENKSQTQGDVYLGEHEQSGIKHKLGQLGRRIKRVDLRSTIIEHPLAAAGIAAGIGAIIGLARPMPRRSRVSGLLFGALSAIGFRLAREAIMVNVSDYARSVIGTRQDVREGMSAQAPQAGTSSSYATSTSTSKPTTY